MMKWSVTFDRLPSTACIGGTVYDVSFGYRAMMAAEIEMFRQDIGDEQKMLNALNMFYIRNIPPDLDAAVDYMLWFHRGGEPARKGGGSKRRTTRRGYCFLKDAPLIYAAFRQQYGINLRQTPNDSLHWWEFLAMFEALDETPGWRRSCTGEPVIPKEWEKSKKRISSRCGHFIPWRSRRQRWIAG